MTNVRGNQMYGNRIKSETLLARAIHLLTLGAYAWDDNCSNNTVPDDSSWRDLGGGDTGSVFHDERESAPNASDWVVMALLREPSDVMDCEWYRGKENTLALLKKIGYEGGNHGAFLSGVDPALRSGASWLCDFAAKVNPIVAAETDVGSTRRERAKEEEQQQRKTAAKEKAMAAMKAQVCLMFRLNDFFHHVSLFSCRIHFLSPLAQMAKFAANIVNSPGFEDDEHIGDNADSGCSPAANEIYSTPVRSRPGLESEAVQAMDLSPGDFIFTSTIASPSTPFTPRTPLTPYDSCYSTPRTSHHAGIRLMNERPRCIVCGADDPLQIDDTLKGDQEVKSSATATPRVDASQQRVLAFCGYSQASTVIKGSDEIPPCGSDITAMRDGHVGVHIALCGHAIHKGCCDAYLKTVASQRDDRLEGTKSREFKCPLCQRLSNCLLPFVDVAADWVDRVALTNEKASTSPTTASIKEGGDDTRNSIDEPFFKCDDRSLHDFLSTSEWWATRNDTSMSWDGHCTFSAKIEKSKHLDLPILSPSRQSLKTIQSKFGKKELISAWNAILKTPRLVKRRARSFSADLSPCDQECESNNSDVLRRFLDQLSDVAYRADLRRVGEESLFTDFGEFRHYHSEKAAYNKVNRAAGKEMVDVSHFRRLVWRRGTMTALNSLLLPPP